MIGQKRCRAVLLALASLAALSAPQAATRPSERAREVMVAGPEPLAVEAAVRVLREGGNAVDAAVTMAFVLAVTWPHAGNIGGGGYMLIHKPGLDPVVIDYREMAPATAFRDMFLDEAGNAISDESLMTYKAAGVPGTVAGLALALEKHGTISWRSALAPAIRLAREGFIVRRSLEDHLARSRKSLERWPATRAIFFRDGRPMQEGDRLKQKDLAATLATLASRGPRAFYEGSVARAIEADMRAHGGLITVRDLAAYTAIERRPLIGTYRSFDIITVPPSSAGGVALLEMLNMIEPHDLKALGHNSSDYIHLVSEAMKRAFADRSRWLGDPAFIDVPLSGLLAREYATARMRGFDQERATPAVAVGPGDPLAFEKPSTTHFSIIDRTGGIVSNTYTLNESFGSGAVVEGLGFLLNNEMDDFSIKPGLPNLFGLTGGEANSIAPGKRMLSSMTPTIVMERDAAGRSRPLMALGSPGGSVIISAVLQVLLGVTDFGLELQAAVDAPRFHHQWQPDQLFLDRGVFPADVISALQRRGHEVIEREPRGEVQAILVDRQTGWLRGAADARGSGACRGY